MEDRGGGDGYTSKIGRREWAPSTINGVGVCGIEMVARVKEIMDSTKRLEDGLANKDQCSISIVVASTPCWSEKRSSRWATWTRVPSRGDKRIGSPRPAKRGLGEPILVS